MANTANYGWSKPTVNGNTNAWGTILNALFDAADTSLKAVEDIANAALPKAGGVMTGRIDAKTATMKAIALGSVTGAVTFDLSTGQYFTLTTTGNTAWTATNFPAGTVVTAWIVRVVNPGAFTITLSGVDWPGGVLPSMTVAGTDIWGFMSDTNGTNIRAFVIAKDVKPVP